MGSTGDVIRAIFVKDLVTELRAKQLLPTIVCLGILIVWIFRVAAPVSAFAESTGAGCLFGSLVAVSVLVTAERAVAGGLFGSVETVLGPLVRAEPAVA